MLDVVVLACFYTLRLLAGGAATAIGVSDWLLAFSVFFFFGLAMVKRYSELRELAVPPDGSAVGRGYFRSDLEPIGTFGVASGMISVLVLVLYVMSPEVRLLYRHPAILLLLCPLFLYWITRLWFKANRGEVILIDFQRIPGVSPDFVMNHVRAGQEIFTKEIIDAGFEQIGERKGLLKESYFVRFRRAEK